MIYNYSLSMTQGQNSRRGTQDPGPEIECYIIYHKSMADVKKFSLCKYDSVIAILYMVRNRFPKIKRFNQFIKNSGCIYIGLWWQ